MKETERIEAYCDHLVYLHLMSQLPSTTTRKGRRQILTQKTSYLEHGH